MSCMHNILETFFLESSLCFTTLTHIHGLMQKHVLTRTGMSLYLFCTFKGVFFSKVCYYSYLNTNKRITLLISNLLIYILTTGYGNRKYTVFEMYMYAYIQTISPGYFLYIIPFFYLTVGIINFNLLSGVSLSALWLTCPSFVWKTKQFIFFKFLSAYECISIIFSFGCISQWHKMHVLISTSIF